MKHLKRSVTALLIVMSLTLFTACDLGSILDRLGLNGNGNGNDNTDISTAAEFDKYFSDFAAESSYTFTQTTTVKTTPATVITAEVKRDGNIAYSRTQSSDYGNAEECYIKTDEGVLYYIKMSSEWNMTEPPASTDNMLNEIFTLNSPFNKLLSTGKKFDYSADEKVFIIKEGESLNLLNDTSEILPEEIFSGFDIQIDFVYAEVKFSGSICIILADYSMYMDLGVGLGVMEMDFTVQYVITDVGNTSLSGLNLPGA